MSRTYHRSHGCQWVNPRPHRDASLRLHHNGPVLPMVEDKPGLLARLFGGRR